MILPRANVTALLLFRQLFLVDGKGPPQHQRQRGPHLHLHLPDAIGQYADRRLGYLRDGVRHKKRKG